MVVEWVSTLEYYDPSALDAYVLISVTELAHSKVIAIFHTA